MTISIGDGMKFQPAAVSVRPGKPLDLTLRNADESAHDLTLNEGVAQPVKLTANGGKTTSWTVTFDTPGTYKFECSIPGHALLGMRGTITVQWVHPHHGQVQSLSIGVHAPRSVDWGWSR